MNKTQKELRLKQKREQARFRKDKKQQVAESDILDELEEDIQEDELLAIVDDPESDDSNEREKERGKRKDGDSVHKEYLGEGGIFLGPTSFEELDALEAAREQAHEINEVSWQVSDLVYNIIRNPMMEPKAKSAAIKNVGDGFETRVSAILSGESVEKDLDVLSIEALLAYDARHTGVVEKALDWVNGKTLTEAGRKKLADDQYGLPDQKKYPIHDKAHVRKALGRAAQQIKSGGEGAVDARTALPRIRAAAKKYGIEVSTEKQNNAIVVEKDAKGEWRWVGWSSNKFMDWDGEILAEVAHKEYTEWLDENPDMSPVFMSWHTPETVRKNAVDFWTYENGFLIMSGPLAEEEAAGLLRVQKDIDLGMSHGTIVLARDPGNKKIITKYRMFEVSELPLENAANPFTSFDTVAKEAGMDKKAYFASLFGEDKAQKYLDLTKQAEEKLEGAGVQSKELAVSGEQKAEGTTQKVESGAAQGAPALSAKDLEAIVKAVGDKYDMDGLNAYLADAQTAIEKVPVLEELVKSLAEGQDDALAEKISPKAGFVWSVQKARASQSDKSKLEEGNEADEKLKKSAPHFDPDVDWLSAQTNIAPIRQS